MKYSIFLVVAIICCFSLQAQWNTNTSINLEIAALPTADMHSITTSDGKTWIAFYHENAGNYDMRAQLLDANGNKLLGPNGILVGNKPSGSATFVFNICLDKSDNLIIAYQDERVSGSNNAVIYKISPSGNFLWGTDGIVLGQGLAPNPATLSNGETIVAWNDNTSNTLVFQKITVGGTIAWTTPKSVTVGASRTSAGQPVPNDVGTFNLVFQKKLSFGINSYLYSMRYSNDGVALWSNPVQLSNEATAIVRYYSVTAEHDTTYCGFYSSPSSRFNSWVQRINPDGSLPYGSNGSNFSNATNANDPYQMTTNIALTPGSPYLWSICTMSNTSQSQYGVFVQKFKKSDGSRMLGATGLNVYPISANFDTHAGSLSLVNDGPLFMSYDIDYKMYATRLDSNGGFVWTANRIEMSSTSAGGSTPKGRFGFTGLNNNQAVTVWYESRGSEYRSYAQNITPGGLFSLKVSTQGGVPASINTLGGSLQMIANVYPATSNQAVVWNIVPITGTATISTSGLIAAQTNGTIWAKAISVQDSTVSDSMLITISNQSIEVISLVVNTQGNIPSIINTNNGTLQMVAVITPSNATNQSVTWSIIPVTGTASVSSSGLVTALSNGTVWAKAVSVSNPAAMDSMLININNQFIQVISLVVNTQGGLPAVINTNNGTLQMVAVITPSNATNQSVTWSIIPVTGTASVSSSGLVTALSNGTVWAKAVSVSNSLAMDSMLVSISNQDGYSNQGLALFPNPSFGFFNLQTDRSHTAVTLQICDAIGRVVYKQMLAANVLMSKTNFNLRHLNSGIYFVYFIGDKSLGTFKWINIQN